MKNNKIENLLKQENNAPDILTEIKTPKTFVKKEKASFVSKFTLKQRVVALSVACSLIVIAIITPLLIIFLGNGNGGMENYDKLIIKDFEQYDKIGVGVESTTSTGMSGLGFASLGTTYASSGNKKHKLIGQKKNGEIEQLILKDMTTEEETTPSLEVTQIWSGNNFTIVKYCTWPLSAYREWIFERQSNYQALYLIDNNTGKFYSLNNFSSFSIGRRNYNDSFVEEELAESNDSLIIFGLLEKDSDYNYSSYEAEKSSLFELKIVENELKIEKLISFKDYNFANYFVDRYSNIYIGGKTNTTNSGLEFMYTRTYDAPQVKGIKFTPSAILRASENYAIETITEELVFSQNKIVYTANGQYYYNEYGEKVTNDFSGFDYFHTKDTLIQKDGNTEFYYLNERRWDAYQTKHVYYIEKLVWIDDTKFAVEEIIINDYTDNYVFTNDRIYFLKNEEVFSISIYDGSKESLVSDYLFNDIQTNNLGEVLFTAINKSDRQAVNGKINKLGQIEINFQKIKYDVLYIKPLN